MLGYFIWDPNPEMFKFSIPYLGRPLLWYGFFFALGFFVGYQVFIYLFKKNVDKESARKTGDSLAGYLIIGTLLGARLGDIIFYQGIETLHNPLRIFKIWEGGLASHGAAIGILLALILFCYNKKLPYLKVLDLVVIAVAFTGAFIRIGNFFNQEILGTPSNLPWAVMFLHPMDGADIVARHPVQIYESLCYFSVGLFLIYLAKFKNYLAGRISGLFLVLVFTFRFFIEFIKDEQSMLMLDYKHALTMGQYLSIPFILIGLGLIFWRGRAYQKE